MVIGKVDRNIEHEIYLHHLVLLLRDVIVQISLFTPLQFPERPVLLGLARLALAVLVASAKVVGAIVDGQLLPRLDLPLLFEADLFVGKTSKLAVGVAVVFFFILPRLGSDTIYFLEGFT